MAWQAVLASIGRAAQKVAASAAVAMNVTAKVAERRGGLAGVTQEAFLGQQQRVSAFGGLSEAAGSAGRNVMAGVAIGGATGGPAGAVVGGLAAVGMELATLPAKFRDLGASVLEASRGMSQLNGSLASAYARLDADRFRRNVRIAADTSGSTKRLTESQNKLEEALRPGQVALTNLGNVALAKAQDALATFVKLGEPIVSAINWMVENWFGEDKAANNNAPVLLDLLNQIRSGAFDKPMRPPMGPVFVPSPKAGP